jgi:hypothetical protein
VVLRPISGAVAGVAGVVRVYATVVLVAALVIAAVVVIEGTGSTALTTVLVTLALAPPVVLFFAYAALRGVVEILDRLAAFPDLARRHADDVRDAVAEGNVLVREMDSRRRPPIRRVVALLWRLRSLVSAARDLVPGYQPVLLLAKPALLVPVAVAAVAGAIEVALAPIVLLVSVVA